jgi:hypothetical protein
VKYLKVFIVIMFALGLVAAFVGCKKAEEVPTAETAAETVAETAAEEVACPAPGEDLICEGCETLFMTDEEYASHMEETHPDKWAKMHEKFWEMRETEGTE